jgi:DNA-binding winged helix-turn-helix (wHTH) protein
MRRRYVIDDYIIFTPSDSMVRLKSGALQDINEVLLPVPASRLLSVLLENRNQILSKEELLNRVWESHGMKGSTHNLAHYTMLIRKAFKTLDFSRTIIVTIHKKGLVINPDLKVSYQYDADADADAEIVVKSDPDDSVITEHFETHNTQRIRKNNRMVKFIMLRPFLCSTLFIFIFSMCAVIFFSNKYNGEFSYSNLRLFKTEQNCQFYTFNRKINDNLLLTNMQEKLKYFPLDCKKNRVVIYTTDAFLGPNLTGKHFHSSLILCTETSDVSNLGSCVSHYFN